MNIKAYERYKNLRESLFLGLQLWTMVGDPLGGWDTVEVKFVEEPPSTENMDYLNGLAEAQDYINANQRPKD